MSVKSRTIDNLGKDASIRYAKDQELFERLIIADSILIPNKTEVSVAKPNFLSEFEQSYSVGKTTAWALFSPPPNFFGAAKTLFSYRLIPSLGEYEKWETDSDKLESFDAMKWEEKEEDESDKHEKERQILLALFQCISQLDKSLSLINARRNQYQRG